MMYDFDSNCRDRRIQVSEVTTAATVAISKQHSLSNIIFCRPLPLPLIPSSERLDDSKALINHLVRNLHMRISFETWRSFSDPLGILRRT